MSSGPSRPFEVDASSVQDASPEPIAESLEYQSPSLLEYCAQMVVIWIGYVQG